VLGYCLDEERWLRGERISWEFVRGRGGGGGWTYGGRTFGVGCCEEGSGSLGEELESSPRRSLALAECSS
jgi:hypothetical protein